MLVAMWMQSINKMAACATSQAKGRNHIMFRYLCFISLVIASTCLPDQGKWSYRFTKSENPELIGIAKSLYNQSTISIKVTCDLESESDSDSVEISWIVRQTPCYEEYINIASQPSEILNDYYNNPYGPRPPYTYKVVHFLKSLIYTNRKCIHGLQINIPTPRTWTNYEIASKTENVTLKGKALPDQADVKVKRAAAQPTPSNDSQKVTPVKPTNKSVVAPVSGGRPDKIAPPSGKAQDPQIIVDRDGVFLLILKVSVPGQSSSSGMRTLSATVDIAMEGPMGYLSAVDWPLLPFYGVMCIVYLTYGIIWLIVSACQWRDLIRIQFWIGGVIVLGMLEKAVFYAEYQSINSTGTSVVEGAVLFAEIVSCCKRTLARMLVIIVSLGFGIVKPRLGPMLHRVLGVGTLYFILGSIEGCSRVLKTKNDPSNQSLMASIPLAVLDSAICWWVFSSLVQTTRTLRLRRNVVKLSLYRHFTNTLVFAVLASVAFMIWSIHSHRLTDCLTDWKELWIDEAYWHLLFSVILLVIMILWRPNNNNQRYAFTPLLDMEDDEEDDIAPTNDAFAGMTMRGGKNSSMPSMKSKDEKLDDDLKWVEENIPSSLADSALPGLVDSEEEIMTTKFELSKME